jgi:hypothetical protein
MREKQWPIAMALLLTSMSWAAAQGSAPQTTSPSPPQPTQAESERGGATPGGTPPGAAAPAGQSSAGAQSTMPAGPIGSTDQTVPAKFSAPNDALDHLPILGRPLPLTDDQKRRIYDSVAGSQTPIATIDAKPADELPSTVELHELPAAATDDPWLKGFKFVRLPDKVLLVRAPNRIVVGVIGR